MLEHLLLALIDDVGASAVMKACKVDLGALKAHLVRLALLRSMSRRAARPF
jgi:hypothetical protein